MTKQGWDQSAPLSRSSLELIATVPHDSSAASTNPAHQVVIPEVRSGYHVILAVWDIYDTGNAFYNVVDVDVTPGSGTETGSGETGSGETGSGETGTGSGETGSGETGTGSGETGSGETGSGETGHGSGHGETGTGTREAWHPFRAYSVGDRVSHEGRDDVAIQSYQGWGDPNWINAPSLWAQLP